MSTFPHLQLTSKIDGLHKPKSVVVQKITDPITASNLKNRKEHGEALLADVSHLSSYWAENMKSRSENQLPDLPDPTVIPIFLQLDAKEFDIETLKGFGIEIISEEEDGFIIGASADNFISLTKKIDSFLKKEGKSKDKAARLWSINTGIQWRFERIISEELLLKWGTISDTEELIIDLGIACYLKMSRSPERKENETEIKFNKRLQRWQIKNIDLDIQRQDIADKRIKSFENYIKAYNGELLDSYVDFGDSFSVRIKISGKGLKDLVLNYQYLFEVVEHDYLSIEDSSTGEIDSINPTLIKPGVGFAKVCVIDSGIQEDHRLIANAINVYESKSFIPNDLSTADAVANGGHGTRVAGAILFPHSMPRDGNYQLPCFIQNAKVLTNYNGRGILPATLYPPKLMENIVNHFIDTRIFNMSINSYTPCKLVHMSQWASSIDKLMMEKNILFILSAGNLSMSTQDNVNPGVKEHLNAGRDYPNYLLEKSSRIGNPAQSCFALSVGSVCYTKFDDGFKESFGNEHDPSSFSRTGLGLWGMIKPDVVEYAGDIVKEKNSNPNLSNEASIAPELVKSTYGGGNGVGRDSVGTSYAAPRVAHIASVLQRLYPNESSNLYRALIVQSARLPESIFSNPNLNHIRHYGYGIPNLLRATENSENRVTLIASDELSAKKADVYSVKVPPQMRRQGDDIDMLVEVTLSYMSKPRRTRRKTKSYLSTWLDWESSKLNESYEQFTNRVLKDVDNPEDNVEDKYSIKWVIRERGNWSKITGLRRQDSSIQKSWCVMKSYLLPETLNIAIIGHTGWELDLEEKAPYSIAVTFEALNSNINIYEMIRIENEVIIPVEIEQEITL